MAQLNWESAFGSFCANAADSLTALAAAPEELTEARAEIERLQHRLSE
jgi:hypothetical protein